MFEKTQQGVIAHPPVNGGELDSIGYACEVLKDSSLRFCCISIIC